MAHTDKPKRQRPATPPAHSAHQPPPVSSTRRWLLALTAMVYLVWLSYLASVALLWAAS